MWTVTVYVQGNQDRPVTSEYSTEREAIDAIESAQRMGDSWKLTPDPATVNARLRKAIFGW